MATSDSVLQSSYVGTPGLQTFNAAYPFDVAIQNHYRGQQLPVLYIVSSATADESSLELTFRYIPKHSELYTFQGFGFVPPGTPTTAPAGSLPPILAPGNSVFVPGPSQYNLSFAFRPGTLEDSVVSNFSNMLLTALAGSFSSANSAAVRGPVVRTTDGALVWYAAFENDLPIGTGFCFTISGVSAAPGNGSRSTQVEFGLGNLYRNTAGEALAFKRNAFLDIVNHQGQAFAPLYFAVLGKNVLLNGGEQGQKLDLYFETLNREPIEFGEGTTFDFCFPYGGKSSVLMHFGTEKEVGAYTLGSVEIQSDSSTAVAPPKTYHPDAVNDTQTMCQKLSVEFRSTGTVANEAYSELAGDITLQTSNATASAAYFASSGGPQAEATIVWATTAAQIAQYLKDANACAGALGPNNGPQGPFCGSQGLLWEFDPDVTTEDEDVVIACSMDCINTPFSVAAWNRCHAAMVQNCSNISASLPPSPLSNSYYESFGPEKRWADPDFLAFIAENFSVVGNVLATNWSNYSGGRAFSPYTYSISYSPRLVPCASLYDLFYSVYLMQKTTGSGSSYLLDVTKPISAETWSAAFAAAESAFGAAANVLTAEAPEVTTPYNAANPFYDENLLDFASTNFATLVGDITAANPAPDAQPIVIENSYLGTTATCVVPCRALFDFLYSRYQLSLITPLLANTPQSLKVYSSPVSCVFHFTGIQLSGNDGTVMIGVTVRGLPGYWDTTFQIPIVKETSSLQRVLELGDAGTPGRLGIGSRIDFLSAGQTTVNSVKVATVSIEESGGLNIYGDETHPVHVNANLFVNGIQLTSSDRNLKESIEPLGGELLSAALQLRPRSYRLKGQTSGTRRSLGLIAQEVKEVLPDLVEERNGQSYVSYQELSVLALATVQRQQELIDNLMQRISDLEAQAQREGDRKDG